ncbi:MAG: hypothetical protein ACFB2Y_20520 [Fulvivirga sp.]
MRNGIIQEEASNPGLHSILSTSGPFDIASNSTIYPFKLAVVVGETLDELKDAVMNAHTRNFNLTNLSEEIQRKDLDVNLNPFNDFTRIKFFASIKWKI